MRKTVAIITCNIGGIDAIYPPAKQSCDFDFFYYSENNLPFPLPELGNRLKGKYLKTQGHKFLNHDIFIWIDGSVEITNETFVEMILKEMETTELLIQEHPERKSVYEEFDYINKRMRQGNKYLLSRYAGQPFAQERDFYLKKGFPKNFPLYQCWFFVRLNNKRMNKAFDDWWDLILRFTNFDQSQFSYIAWKNNLQIKTIDTKDLLIRHKHE